MHLEKALNQVYSGMLLQVVEVTITLQGSEPKSRLDTVESQYGFIIVPIEDEFGKVTVSEPRWIRIDSVVAEVDYDNRIKLTFILEGGSRISTRKGTDEAYMASIVRSSAPVDTTDKALPTWLPTELGDEGIVILDELKRDPLIWRP